METKEEIPMNSKFNSRLQELINSRAKEATNTSKTAKTASAGDISVDGLRKIANILRTNSVEPTYEDLHEMYSRIKR